MTDEERIEQLELEVKVLQANNKGLKDKIDEQSKDKKIFLQFGEIVEKKRWKDKIKAKIEEIEEKRHYLEINDEYNTQICDCIIEEYKSLLEKE